MKSDSHTAAPTRVIRRGHLWLLSLPFVWQLGMAPFVNDVSYKPFGLPFPMAWQMAGVILSAVLFALVFELDRRAGVQDEEEAFMAAIAASEGAPAQLKGHA